MKLARVARPPRLTAEDGATATANVFSFSFSDFWWGRDKVYIGNYRVGDEN